MNVETLRETPVLGFREVEFLFNAHSVNFPETWTDFALMVSHYGKKGAGQWLSADVFAFLGY